MRTIIVGDIHGECDKFESLLIKVDFSETDDKLILLGDLIDRGQDSYRVVSLATGLKKVMAGRLIILRGSHEKGFALDYAVERKLPQNGVICIDTNCGNGGQLTAMIICGETYRPECVR